MEEDKIGYQDEEVVGIVERYERMRKNNENHFFDVSEFETIIDYYLEQNDVTIAYEAAEAASSQHPNSVSLDLRKAKVLIDKGRAVEALKVIKRFESIEPDNYEVYLIKGAALGMMGDMQGVSKNFDYALSLDSSEEINILLGITSILYNLNNFQLLIPYLKRLNLLEPDYYTHIYDLAFAYEKLQDYENSIKNYNLYLAKVPFSDSAWYNLGILYNKTKKADKAIEAYDFALAVNPDHFFALFNKGNILSNEGRYEAALNAYLEYLVFEEESSEALTYAAECYEKLGDHESAVKYYLDAIDIDPDFSEPWFGLGITYLNDNKQDESLNYFNKAVKLAPENPEYWYYLGKAYYRFHEVKKAVRSFMAAIKIDPFYDVVWNDIGHLVISEGLYFKVSSIMEKALRITGDVHGLRFVLAASYLYSGDNDKSYYHLSKAVKMAERGAKEFIELFPEHLLNDELKILLTEKE
ncbi:MAG: tetratricopeptide repeat protein [Bacteroidales bacterium]|nr:tetratricopeptide repeat protein [Bacteroidales bacterium]